VPLIVGTTHDEYEWFHMVQAGEARSMLVNDAQLEQAIAACRRLLPSPWSEEEIRSHAITCADWRMPAIRLAQASVDAGAPTWMYRLDWRLAPRGVGVGAPHGLDASLMSPKEPDYESVIIPAARRDIKDLEDVIEAMREAIARFVATGNPGPQWPAYDLAARSTFLFDDTCSVAGDPERDVRLLWENVIQTGVTPRD
jgi:para-nitrobenzyl esterase